MSFSPGAALRRQGGGALPYVLSVAVASIACGYLASTFGGKHPLVLVVAMLALVVVASMALIRREWLPAVALAGTVFVPFEYAHPPSLLTTVSPPSLLLLKPLYDSFRTRRRGSGAATFAATTVLLFQGLLVALIPLSPDPIQGARWVVAFALGVTIPTLWGCWGGATHRLRWAFEVIAGVLGVYALVEAAIGHNPLFGQFFAGSAVGLTQDWSTYRATTTLGHPLVNGMFLACGASMALGSYLDRGQISRLALAVAATGGVIATASRSGVVALGVALLLVLALSWSDRAARLRAAGVAVGAVVTVGFLGSVVLGAVISRSGTTEAALSTAWREKLWRTSVYLVDQQPIRGHGPGSLHTLSQVAGLGSTGNFENSWLDLLLISGFTGCLLLLATFLGAGLRAVRCRDSGALGAVVALAITASAFNLWSGHPTLLFVSGAVLAIALSPSSTRPSPLRGRVGVMASRVPDE